MIAMSAKDIMTRNVVTVAEEDNLLTVRARLAQHSFHHLPVVDGARVVGMLSQRDVLRATVAGVDEGAFARARERAFLERTFVRDLMNVDVALASAHDSIGVLARRILARKIGALPVVDDDDNLVGIVTENDLVRCLAESP